MNEQRAHGGRLGRMRALVMAVARHPNLWGEAMRAGVALIPRRWWRQRPYLPVPDRRYLAWRVATAYGDPAAQVVSDDVLAYLRWRARQRCR